VDISHLVLKAQENIKNNPSLKQKRELADYLHGFIPRLAAFLVGAYVPLEQRLKRLEICATCELLSFNGNRLMCSVCSCHLGGSTAIMSLVSFEETKFYGCGDPSGSRWKKNNC
jgi:hypothetical protein